jgi:hypothetical protein
VYNYEYCKAHLGTPAVYKGKHQNEKKENLKNTKNIKSLQTHEVLKTHNTPNALKPKKRSTLKNVSLAFPMTFPQSCGQIVRRWNN